MHNHFRRTPAPADPPLSIETEWPAMYGRATLAEMLIQQATSLIDSGDHYIVMVSSGSVESMSDFADFIKQRGKTMVLYSTWANPDP